MYRALYRKYRPKTFADVFGQDAVTTALKNQVERGRVGHAYLFTGTRGTGKTTCAKILAKAVNCRAPKGGEPCGECAVCRGLEDGSILDVQEIDAASNTGVDDVRDLRDEAVYAPINCSYKVYIIDEVHMLSNNAFNALLKIMEEPPAHVIFILATTEVQKVPATILSRCQRYDFGRIPAGLIQQRLQQVAQREEIELSPGAAALIARLADGALRDGLSILDTCASTGQPVEEGLVRRMAGVTDRGHLFDLSEAVAAQDGLQALAQVAALRERSVSMKRLCEDLIEHYRTLLLVGAGAGELGLNLSQEEEARYRALAARLPMGQLVTAMRALGDCLDRMSRGTDPRVELELALFALCSPQPAAVPQPAAAAPAVSAAPPPKAQAARPAQPVPAVAPPPAPKPGPDTAGQTSAAAVDAAAGGGAPPQGPGEIPCSFWPKVIELAAQSDPMMHGFLTGSKAYLQGRRVLVDGSPLFLKFMKTNGDSAQRLKALIEQASGERYAIGPYPKPQAGGGPQPGPTRAEETLRQLQAAGVPVEYR